MAPPSASPEPPRPEALPLLWPTPETPDWSELLPVLGLAVVSFLVSPELFMSVVDGCPALEGLALLPLLLV